jgi:hypothetical protein
MQACRSEDRWVERLDRVDDDGLTRGERPHIWSDPVLDVAVSQIMPCSQFEPAPLVSSPQ